MRTISPIKQAIDLRPIRERLTLSFESIRVEERPDPVSQMVKSFIGRNTYGRKSWVFFVRLDQRFPNCDAMADASGSDIETTFEDIVFSEKRASEIRQKLHATWTRFSQIALDFLAGQTVDQALNCLGKIHGIERKIAIEILSFRPLRLLAFAVDMYVLRLLQIFVYIGAKADTKIMYGVVMSASGGLEADDLF